MIIQYKSHVLNLLELNIGGFYHANVTALAPLAQVQNSFIKRIGLTAESAFLDHNLLPLNARRDIAMLGLMHRCVHGNAHKDLRQQFPRVPGTHAYETRQQMSRHKLQLVGARRDSP